jgi:capsid protein
MIVVINNGKATPLRRGKQMTGEKIPGDLKSWDHMGTDPNELLLWSYDILSERSTTLYHTHAPVAGAINKLTNYAIGNGNVFRSQPDWEILEIKKDYAKDWGMRFQKLVHYTFKLLNYYEKQSLLFRTALVMGDSLLIFDRNSKPFGMPFDLVESGGDQISFQAKGTTLGIYHDGLLRRQGVALYGKQEKTPFTDENGDQNIIQFYLKLIARQLRGYPAAYRIIAAAKNNDRWWDATLARAVLEATIFASVKEQNAGDTNLQMEALHDALYNENGKKANTLERENVFDIGAGNILSYGKNAGPIEFSDLKTPSGNFDKMQAAYIDMVGMATDVPPEYVMSRYNTSYTAHKGAGNDFIRSYMQKRNRFNYNVDRPVIRELAKYFFMAGLIEMPNPKFFTSAIIQEATIAGKFIGPVPGHINPLQEVNANVKAVDNAFELRSDIAAQYGNEWDNAIEEWQIEEDEFRKKKPQIQAQIIGQEMDEADRNDNQNENKGDDE